MSAQAGGLIKAVSDKINLNTTSRTLFYDAAAPYQVLNELNVRVHPQYEEVDFYGGYRIPDNDYVPLTSQAVRRWHKEREERKRNIVELKEIMNSFESGQITLTGPAGSGKTTSLKGIAGDAKNGEYENLKEVETVHFMECRDIQGGHDMSVGEFLFSSVQPELEVNEAEQILACARDNPSKFLFVIDSLDTCPFQLDGTYEPMGLDDRGSPARILWNLLSGHLLPGCRFITSSREHAIRNYEGDLRASKVIALAGLTETSIKEITTGYVGEEESEEILKDLERKSPALLALCATPVFLVFTLIGLKINSKFKPTTMSGIMILLLESLLHSQHAHELNIQDVMNKLKELSFIGTKEGRVLFKIDELERFNLLPDQVTDLAILAPGGRKKLILEKHDDVLFFCHQSIQETLSAFYIAEMDMEEFKAFISEHIHTPHYAVIRRILCGVLLDEEVVRASENLVHVGTNLKEKQEFLKQSLSDQLARVKEGADRLELFTSMHEAGDGMNDVIRESVREIDLQDLSLTAGDVQAVASIASKCDELDKLWLINCNLTSTPLEMLSSLLEESKTKVGFFDLSFNIASPTTRDIETVAKLLSNAKEELWLRGWNVQAEGRAILREELEKCQTKLKIIFDFNDELMIGSQEDNAETKSGNFGPDGDCIDLGEGKVTSPPGSVDVLNPVQLSLDVNSEFLPEGYLCIAPALTSTPSIEFKLPAKVQLTRWCSTESPEVMVEVLNQEEGNSDLQTIARFPLATTDRMFQFETKKISRILVCVKKSFFPLLRYLTSVGLYFNPNGTFSTSFRAKIQIVRDKCRKRFKDEHFKPTNVMIKYPLAFKVGEKVQVFLECREPEKYTFQPVHFEEFHVDEMFARNLHIFSDIEIKPLPPPLQALQLTYNISGVDPIDFHHTWPENFAPAIGCEGGVQNIDEFTKARFPPGALDKPIHFKFSLDVDLDDSCAGPSLAKKARLESELIPISAALTCKPSMRFHVPVEMELMLWCTNAAEEDLMVEVKSQEDDSSDWQTIARVPLPCDSRIIRFPCSHFSKIRAFFRRLFNCPLKFHVAFGLYYHPDGNFSAAMYMNDQTVENNMQRRMEDRNYKLTPAIFNPKTVKEGETVEWFLQCLHPAGVGFEPATPQWFIVDEDFEKNIFHREMFTLEPLPRTGQRLKLSCILQGSAPMKFLLSWQHAGSGIVVEPQGDAEDRAFVEQPDPELERAEVEEEMMAEAVGQVDNNAEPIPEGEDDVGNVQGAEDVGGVQGAEDVGGVQGAEDVGGVQDAEYVGGVLPNIIIVGDVENLILNPNEVQIG